MATKKTTSSIAWIFLQCELKLVFFNFLYHGEFLNFGDQFQDGNFWKAVEVGYVPSFGKRYFKKISIMYWNSDAYSSVNGSPIASGQGLAVSAHWFFAERFIPFARFGISNGNGENAFYKADVQIGHGYRFLNYDILGNSLSWNQPNIPDVKDQITTELFYRFNMTTHFELTPSMQFIMRHGDTIRRAVQAGVSAYVVDGLQAQRVRPILEAAIARFEQHRGLQAELDRTRSALEDRKKIERAKGIVMMQRGIGEPAAYGLMRKAAMDQNRRLVEIADSIIAAAELLGGRDVGS